jgi:hypothetical protein
LHSGASTNTRKDDDILLLTLESIDSVEMYLALDISPKSLFKSSLKLYDLTAVHGNDTNSEVKVYVGKLLAQPCVQGEGDLALRSVL